MAPRATPSSSSTSDRGGSPRGRRIGGDGIRAVTDAVQAQSTDIATGGIGAFIAANQEGGRIQALLGIGLRRPSRRPSSRAAWPDDDAANAGGALGPRAPGGGRQPRLRAGRRRRPGRDRRRTTRRSASSTAQYGSDPKAVADHVAAFVDGMTAAGVATTAKHFPGLGRVAENTDFASGVVDTVTTADDPDLEPFRRAIDAGVPAVMLSLATYERMDPDHLAAFSWPIIGGVLEDSLGFGGIVMSDSLSAEAVSSMPAASARRLPRRRWRHARGAPRSTSPSHGGRDRRPRARRRLVPRPHRQRGAAHPARQGSSRPAVVSAGLPPGPVTSTRPRAGRPRRPGSARGGGPARP